MTALKWTSLGGGDQEAFENGYTMRIDIEETSVFWRVGIGSPDDDPHWLIDGSARTRASARRLARGVARLLWKEAERHEEQKYKRMMQRKTVPA